MSDDNPSRLGDQPTARRFVCFGPFRFESQAGRLYRGDVELHLAPKAAAVLELLLSRSGEAVTKEEFLETVWGGVHVGDESLIQAISTVRQALGDTAQSPAYIQTLPGEGYRFIAGVSQGLLPADTSPLAVSLLRRCFRKDPNRRMRDIGDARIEIEEAAADRWPGSGVEASRIAGLPKRLPWPAALALAVVAAVLGATAHALWGPGSTPTSLDAGAGPVGTRPFPIAITLAPGQRPSLSPLAISRDGSKLAHVVAGEGLYLYELGALDSMPVPGAEGGSRPFFAPDGESIGFARGGTLYQQRLGSESAPRAICDVDGGLRGATWRDDDTIVFATSNTPGLQRVSANGTEPPEPLTSPEEGNHAFPEFLPGGDAVVFTIRQSGPTRLAIVDLESGRITALGVEGSDPEYVPGYLLYAHRGSLMAVPFDIESRRTTGTPQAVRNDLGMTQGREEAYFAASETGALFYQTQQLRNEQLILVDRTGDWQPFGDPSPPDRLYEFPRFSPDGTSVALSSFHSHDVDNVLVFDMDAPTPVAVVTEQGESPVWSPIEEGAFVYISSQGDPSVSRATVNGGGQHPVVWSSPSPSALMYASSISPDGKVLLVEARRNDTGWDVVALPLVGEAASEEIELFASERADGAAMFSPDGGWIAFASRQTGSFQIYLCRYPECSRPERITTDGGGEPLWSPNGEELFYLTGDSVMVFRFPDGPGGPREGPEVLFPLPPGIVRWNFHRFYDVHPDGQRFVFVRRLEETLVPPRRILILNWLEELKELVPAGGGSR